MAIIAPQTAPNFATGNYHRILKVEILCGPRESIPRYNILVGFYAHEAARDSNADPMYVNAVQIPFTNGVEDPRGYLYDLLMKSELFAGTNATSDHTTPAPQTRSYAPQGLVGIPAPIVDPASLVPIIDTSIERDLK